MENSKKKERKTYPQPSIDKKEKKSYNGNNKLEERKKAGEERQKELHQVACQKPFHWRRFKQLTTKK